MERRSKGAMAFLKSVRFYRSGLVLLAIFASALTQGAIHPRTILTPEGVEHIRAHLGNVPLFDATVARVKTIVDQEMAIGIDTPIPRDYSGGYTHERHKKNYLVAQYAGALYQILQDDKYAEYVRDMLLQYESMYLDLPLHPKTRSYARGKLFWQCLNDSNWLLAMAQAYDAVYNFLTVAERQRLEKNLFKPFADFLSLENPQFFNRIHNHSAWGNAAVGMIGLVMGDTDLINRALYGLQLDQADLDARDNDGGFIFSQEGRAGFLANLEEPFSPSGYYTEGPYYQRYAMYPFLVFAIAMKNAGSEVDVLGHKDQVLLKAVDALLNLSDDNGDFFALNDAQKGMSIANSSLVSAVNFAYFYGKQDPSLLSVAQQQGQVQLDQAGLAVAKDIALGNAGAFSRVSSNYGDGPDGNAGGISILRDESPGMAVVFKYTSQGLSHGHYDKLSFSLHDHGHEILQDYGMVRFVNIEQKGGGNYLPENTTWAKQSIAHNTIVVDALSHFSGKYEIGSQYHSKLHLYDAADPRIKIISAIENNAYSGVNLHRTMSLVRSTKHGTSFVVDLIKVGADTTHQYDIPFYYLGQPISTNFEHQVPRVLDVLGSGSGYQHLFLEAVADKLPEQSKFSWLNNGRFYTFISNTNETDQIIFARLGANDPNFNLRRDPAFVLRRNGVSDTLFTSVLEPHGSYNPLTELSIDAVGKIVSIETLLDTPLYVAVEVKDIDGCTYRLLISNEDADESAVHEAQIGSKQYRWIGPYLFLETAGNNS